MKKLISLLLCVCMLFAFAACSEPAPAASEPASNDSKLNTNFDDVGIEDSTDPVENEKDPLPTYKIGFLYSNYTDAVGSMFKNCLEYIAHGMNVEFVFFEGGYSEEVLATIESAVANGEIDGMIAANSATPALIEAVNGLPIMCVCSSPASDEVAKECAKYDNYLGSICDDFYTASYSGAQALYDAGCRNIGIAAVTLGLTNVSDTVVYATRDFVAEHPDMKIIAEDFTRGQFPTSITSFAASYPEMDGIVTASITDAVLNTIVTEGLVGQVKLSGINLTDECVTHYENGTLLCTTAGQYGTAMVGFAILYNYLADGTRIIEDTSVTMWRDYLLIKNMDDFNAYTTYVAGGVPMYFVDEIKDMIHYYNKDVDQAYIEAINEAYSLQDVVDRHSEYFEEK